MALFRKKKVLDEDLIEVEELVEDEDKEELEDEDEDEEKESKAKDSLPAGLRLTDSEVKLVRAMLPDLVSLLDKCHDEEEEKVEDEDEDEKVEDEDIDEDKVTDEEPEEDIEDDDEEEVKDKKKKGKDSFAYLNSRVKKENKLRDEAVAETANTAWSNRFN